MTVCKKLWHNLEIDLEGHIQPCSSFQGSISCQPYDLESYYTSADFQRIILQHQEGTKNTECNICWQQEQQGHRSLRQSTDEIFVALEEKPDFLVLDYSLDHICNLKCLMCNETASSAILAEKKALGLPVIPIRVARDTKRLDFLKDNIKRLHGLKIYNSGEPMLSPLFIPMLDIIDAVNPDLHLMVSTNGMQVSEDIITRLSAIKNLTVKVSIDGYQKVNDFIRYPSDWQTIESNIKKLQQLSNANLIVHSTVQALNILKVELLEYWANDIGVSIELSPVNRTAMLDLRVIPVTARTVIEQRIVKLIKSKIVKRQSSMRLLLATLKTLKEQPVCEISRAELTKFLQDISRIRKIDPRDYIAEELDMLEINT